MRDLGRLRRTGYDRKVAGVAGGLARHVDVDPIILRVAFVVLTFFGGAGLIVYAACWLLVPQDGSDDATLRLDERSRTFALVIVGLIAALALLGDSLGGWGFPWPLAIIGLIVLLIVGTRGPSTPRTYTYTGPPPAGAPPAYAPPAYLPPPLPPQPRGPRRAGPILFWFTLALIALGVGLLGIADLAGADVADSAYPALTLGISGLMLLVGAFFGRAGGLIALGLVAAVATAGATAAGEIDAGRIERTPQSASAVESRYSLGAGEIVLDLTEVADLEALDGETIALDVDFGRVAVIVPEGVDLEVRATVEAAGETNLFGDREDSSNDVSRDGGTDVPTITVDAQVMFGEIEIDTTGRINR